MTLFDLPTEPEEFGISLPPANFRKIDFSGLEFETARRAIVEYIKTYYPDRFNDFVASSAMIMMIEIVASVTAKLSLRSDLLANESTLPTARSEESVVNHLALIGQKLERQRAGTVQFEISVDRPVLTDIVIAAGTAFEVTQSSNNIVYEAYRAPGDWTSPIIIKAGTRGIIAHGIEGRTVSGQSFISNGESDQIFVINANDILDDYVKIIVKNKDVEQEWKMIKEPIELYRANDFVVESSFFETNAQFKFGNNIYGAIPPAGSRISISYRVGGGTKNIINVGVIDTTIQAIPNQPSSAPVSVRVRNLTATSGAVDRESLEHAKQRAPRTYASHNFIATRDDYAQAAIGWSHPAYGRIVKAVAAARTSKNANLVEMYVLADGPNKTLVTASVALKKALNTYLSQRNVMTDHVEVLDGFVKKIDLQMTVVISMHADASVTKAKVELAVDNLFSVANKNFGDPFYMSDLLAAVHSVDGVLYANLISPNYNIVPSEDRVPKSSSANEVGFAELLVVGSRQITYYYDKTK